MQNSKPFSAVIVECQGGYVCSLRFPDGRLNRDIANTSKNILMDVVEDYIKAVGY